ncbi:MAG: class B sortase [Mogibacterium sp.]|uniref:class B sortase n=1 Tax=Mogibacterium sp. TaxID=2049035 RepID=UPI001A403571|nr:class B sortase [Mogibacterium sp.]MBL6468449.1 class B sortase [Mogibacterium sp.]
MNSGKNKNTANRTRPTRQEKRAAKREAKIRRKEALRNAPLSVRIRNGALNVITVCLVGIILVSGYKIGKTMWDYQVAKSAYTNISEKTAKVDPKQFTGVLDWKALKKVNPDVQGWLYQKGTVINYPVVQGTDNDTYLHTRFDKQWSGGGTLFVDCRMEKDFKGFNSIIYGHHMKDGSMFRSIRGYTKEDGYYDKHKTLELATPHGNYHLVVFSAFITKATDENTYKMTYDEAEKQAYIDRAWEQSELPITRDSVDVTKDDRLVTLSTCAYDYEEARYIVMCKMVPWTKAEVQAGKDAQKQIDAQKK